MSQGPEKVDILIQKKTRKRKVVMVSKEAEEEAHVSVLYLEHLYYIVYGTLVLGPA